MCLMHVMATSKIHQCAFLLPRPASSVSASSTQQAASWRGRAGEVPLLPQVQAMLVNVRSDLLSTENCHGS